MVPVKRAWIALKPVSKGEPCAIAATGRTRRTVRRAAVGRPLRPKKGPDLVDGMDSEPTGHLDPPPPKIGSWWRKPNPNSIRMSNNFSSLRYSCQEYQRTMVSRPSRMDFLAGEF